MVDQPLPAVSLLGEFAVTLQIAHDVNHEVFEQISRWAAAIDAAPPVGLREIVPAMVSLTAYFDPEKTTPTQIASAVLRLRPTEIRVAATQNPVIEIPVCYGGTHGVDLNDVSRHSGLSPDEVIRIHSSGEYRVHMVGFMPGFPYLGGMSERIATPRRETPRTSIPPGSVGIGGRQTGIYPLETPGGWQLIGRTPCKLFDPQRVPPTLLVAGDRVCFRPIAVEEFERLTREVTCPSE